MKIPPRLLRIVKNRYPRLSEEQQRRLALHFLIKTGDRKPPKKVSNE